MPENPQEFRADLFALSMRNGVEDVALFMDHTALPRSGRKEGRDGSEQSLMPIGHNQVHLRCPTGELAPLWSSEER